jgi:hypothetical protein
MLGIFIIIKGPGPKTHFSTYVRVHRSRFSRAGLLASSL